MAFEPEPIGLSRLGFGAKPTVLRCSRCGKFVDWEAARLQVVCDCRTHLKLPAVIVRETEKKDHELIRALFMRDFGHAKVVAFGEVMSLDPSPGIVAELKGELAGALTYRFLPDALHIVALATDPMWQRSGVGGHLVAEVEALAARANRGKVVFATTNDNLPALYFYQRRGYEIVDVVPGGILPHLSALGSAAHGFGGIPIRDEIRFEKRLADGALTS